MMPTPQAPSAGALSTPGSVSPPSRSVPPSSARLASRGAQALVLHCPSSLVRFQILPTCSAPPRNGTAGLLYPEAQDVPESEGMLWRRNL
jgi:hypothetical protein